LFYKLGISYSLDGVKLSDANLAREIGTGKYTIAMFGGDIGVGKVAHNEFVTRKSYVCTTPTLIQVGKSVIQALPDIKELNEFKIQLGFGRSNKSFGYYLKGSWFGGKNKKNSLLKDLKKTTLVISGRYRIDIRSRYEDTAGMMRWGRGVSFYLDEFYKFLTSLMELVCQAYPDPGRNNLDDLIRLLGQTISEDFDETTSDYAKYKHLKEKLEQLTKPGLMEKWVEKHCVDQTKKISWVREATYIRSQVLAFASLSIAKKAFAAIEPTPFEKEEEVRRRGEEDEREQDDSPSTKRGRPDAAQ